MFVPSLDDHLKKIAEGSRFSLSLRSTCQNKTPNFQATYVHQPHVQIA